MALPDDLHMRPATGADLPAIASLRESVGWSVHEWALRALLEPPDARCFVVVEPGGSVVAVGSGISYGALGVVGNMVVDAARRRQGIGAAVLEEVIDFLVERGCTRLELYATPAGRPLYERHGFTLAGPSAMVRVPRTGLHGQPPAGITVDEGPDVEELAAYDRPRFGGDRRGLLAMMAADPDRPLLAAHEGSAIRGYLWLRADGGRLGPFLADTPSVAESLLRAAFERAPGVDELALSLSMANAPGIEWLRGLGLELEAWDGRMGRGPMVERRDDTIYSGLVGALG